MRFLHDVKNSLYNPAFYAGLRERSLGASFKYFFALVAILAFVLAFVLGSQLSPLFSAASLKQLVGYYPAELALTLKGGVISTNVAEPYIIKDPVGFWKESGHANFVVIDTKSEFSRELFQKYDTSVLIGKDFVVNGKSRSQFEFTDVSRMPDFTLNQERLLHWADVIGNRHLLLSLCLFAILYLSFFGFFTFKLLWLLVLALLVLLIAKIKKVPLSYKESFKVTLHAATVPLILIAIFIIGGRAEPFLFFYSLILLVIAFVNLKRLEQSPTPSENPIGQP